VRKLMMISKQAKTARVFADRRGDPHATPSRVMSGVTRITTSCPITRSDLEEIAQGTRHVHRCATELPAICAFMRRDRVILTILGRPSSRPSLRIAVVVIAVASSLAYATGWSAPASAATGPTFGPGIEYTGLPQGGSFARVSCTITLTARGSTPPVMFCTAAGTDSNTREPFVATESGGTWGQGMDIDASGGGGFTGISCTTPGNCTAVGTDHSQSPFYAVESNNVWGSATHLNPDPVGGFNGVSCTIVGNCTAVGFDSSGAFYATETDGSWGSAIAVSAGGSGSTLTGINCIDPANCTAVGSDAAGQPIYATESAGVWGAGVEVPVSPSGTFEGVTHEDFVSGPGECTSTTVCVAVGTSNGEPIEATESGGHWGAAVQLTALGGGGSFTDAGCIYKAHCVAVGTDGNAQPIFSDDMAGTPTEVSSPGGEGHFYGVSCTPMGCMAVGQDGNGKPLYAIARTQVPGATDIGAAVASGGGAFVHFTPPSTDGGLTVTGYTVLESSGGPYSVATSPACTGSPCAVTGLTSGTTYTFEVEAVNGVGAGPASAPSNAVTPYTVPPAAPLLIKAKADNKKIKVTWMAPTFDGGSAITKYTASAARGSKAFTCSSRTGPSCTITGLKNGKRYTVSVVATNPAGNSAPSNRKAAKPKA